MCKKGCVKMDNTCKQMTDKHRTYCRCILKVASNNTLHCNKNRNWEDNWNNKCVNPYAICSSKIERDNKEMRKCFNHYHYYSIKNINNKMYESMLKLIQR